MTGRGFRRLEQLEIRPGAAVGIKSLPVRILLVHAEKGLIGVILRDGVKPATVPATAEEEAPRGSGAPRERSDGDRYELMGQR